MNVARRDGKQTAPFVGLFSLAILGQLGWSVAMTQVSVDLLSSTRWTPLGNVGLVLALIGVVSLVVLGMYKSLSEVIQGITAGQGGLHWKSFPKWTALCLLLLSALSWGLSPGGEVAAQAWALGWLALALAAISLYGLCVVAKRD